MVGITYVCGRKKPGKPEQDSMDQNRMRPERDICVFALVPFIALTLLAGRQTGHSAHKNLHLLKIIARVLSGERSQPGVTCKKGNWKMYFLRQVCVSDRRAVTSVITSLYIK